jgi:selenocysteine-specific elongation factor
MNLGGVERTDVARGQVVCGDGIERATDRFDAWVEIRPGARRPLASHARVRLHVGTAEAVGKVVVLGGAPAIAPRQSGWAQVVVTTPVVALRGDRFVLRDETARRTLGGGVVVHPFAARHRRDEPQLVDHLTALRDGDVAAAARALLALAPDFACEGAAIAQALSAGADEATRALAGADDVVALPDASRPEAYATAERWRCLVERMLERVAAAHRERPTEPGVELERLRSELAPEVSARTFRSCVDRLVAERRLVRDDSVVRLPSHRIALDAAGRALGEQVMALLAEGRFMPPDLRQLEAEVAVDRRRLAEVLGVLEKEGRVVRVAPDLYYAPAVVEDAKSLLTGHCRTHGDISAGVFRDLIGASRKFSIAFLDWCDRTGVTTRVGDMRRLRR